MSLLQIRNLSVDFKDEKNDIFHAVKNVNLNLEQGETLGIVGESGSGKSVTALSILGLLPYPKAVHGSKSSIKFSGQELIGLNDEAFQTIRGNKISFIFQEPMSSLNPLHKVGQQIAESLKLHQGLSGKALIKRVLELLRAVKIPQPEEKMNAYPFELSGGQRQRVMIAMAIANNPQILIADEPTTALDVTIQEQIIDLLLELKQKLGMSIIFISHNLRLVHKIADNIAVMYKGEIVEYGTAEKIFTQAEHEYTKKLISSNMLLNKGNYISDDIILKGENIKVSFPLQKNFFGKILKEIQAVNKVSFSLRRGQTLGIVGESGSGKTTLAKCLVGLQKYNGKIYIKNNDIFNEIKSFSHDVQIVFQDPYNSLNPRMTIFDIISEGIRIHFPHITRAEMIERVNDIISEVELTADVLNKYPHEFSGGQRQRIALARVLVLLPRIIILDEPTSALDVTVQAQVVALLQKLQHKFHLSYIFISHDMYAVRAMSHQIIVMKNGKIVEQGAAEDIFRNPQQTYTKKLIKASFI